MGTPSISVVIPTRDRPELLANAVGSVLSQEYPGSVECVVVFDQSAPHPIPVEPGENRTLRTITNDRTPGLAGARNAGILAAAGEVIGHCDDDDEWLPGKLARQIELWRAEPDALAVATGVIVRNDTGAHHRPAPRRVTFTDFLHSRIFEVHSSNLLVRKEDMLGRLGLVDEELPHSFGEDYEWLLRATRHGDIVSVPTPLVQLNWKRTSFYMSRWQSMVDGLRYIVDKVPEFAGAPKGRARLEGQIAFAYAAMGRRGDAVRWALRTLRHDPRQPRALGAFAVASGVVNADKLVRMVQARGKGL